MNQLFRSPRIIKLAIWLLFLLCLVAIFPHSIERQETLGVDYPIFYEAARNHGEAVGYIYPPTLAWLLYPLATLPYHLSSEIWYAIQALAILWVLWICLPAFRPGGVAMLFVEALFVIAVARLLILNAEIGQVNGLVCLLILLAMTSSSDSIAGASLGTATLIKLSPALFLPFAVVQDMDKRWKGSLLFYCGTLALGFGLPLISGFSLSGLTKLAQLSGSAGDNLGLYAYAGKYSYLISAVLILASLIIAARVRGRWEIWLIPVILIMVVPPIVRKAHLIFGLLLGRLLDRADTGRWAWIPVAWASGTLGTMLWPPSAIIGNISALSILLYNLAEGQGKSVAGFPHSRVTSNQPL
ncbi:MAG TPA: glycosyltransferase family 87 protein [Bacteroidota bacterium]|nr:glycosyltransferase family 87 protein [Bacteroidota bacterium]